MMKYFMEFEKGGRFEIELDYDAPMTAAAFKAFMEESSGYQALCLQGRFSGEEMYFPAKLGAKERENKHTKPCRGCLCFNPDPEWSAVCIYWGDETPTRQRYHNLFAHLRGDMEELTEIGTRIWQKGGETVVMKREDE